MKTIEKEYKFEGFKQAMTFVNKVANLAEARDHHPDIMIKYNIVHLSYYTHTAGGVTDKDIRLAAEIEKLIGL